MNIEFTKQIDSIGVSIDTSEVVLTLINGAEWTSEHLLLLQEKLNAYLSFIESGEIFSSYPAAVGRPVAIQLVWRCEPSHEVSLFLAKVTEIVEGAGIRFSHGPGSVTV